MHQNKTRKSKNTSNQLIETNFNKNQLSNHNTSAINNPSIATTFITSSNLINSTSTSTSSNSSSNNNNNSINNNSLNHNNNNNINNINNKTMHKSHNDLKQDHHAMKYTEKSQPTAEQMTIAQIIDTKSEDPALKDKIKQVMDATQRSADEAYTALHDSDNDPNRAVNLLLEGGTKDEWSTSSKKKKVRVPADKNKDCLTTSEMPVIVNQRGSTTNVIANDRSPDRIQTRRMRGVQQNNSSSSTMSNGPGRGSRGGMRGRTSGRGGSFVGGRGIRGGSGPFRKPIETWDSSMSSTSNQNQNDNPRDQECTSTVNIDEDWDNEEYTGSLANSQVFTPSSAQIHSTNTASSTAPAVAAVPAAVVTPSTATLTSRQSGRVDDEQLQTAPPTQMDLIDSNNHMKSEPNNSQPRNHTLTPSRLISHFASLQMHQQQIKSPISQSCSVVMDSGLTSRDLNQVNQALSKFNYLSAIRGSANNRQNIVSQLQDTPTLNDIRIPRIAQNTRVRPRIPPPSKIPLTAVEMPPDVGTSLGLLDVQFGALEFGETNSESVVNSPSTPHNRSPSPATSDDLNPPVSLSHVWCQGNSTEALLSSSDRSFSPVRGTTTVSTNSSLQSQLVDNVTKIGETSSGVTTGAGSGTGGSGVYYQDSQLYQSSLYTKATPQTIYNSTYCSPQVLSSNNTIYSTSSQNIYSSSSMGTYGSSGYQNYQYSSYTSHPPNVQTNSTNSYQTSMGMGSQNYGVTTGGSNSVYGAANSGLGGASSYTTPPYPTYNSTQHNHKSLTSTSSSKEVNFDTAAPSVNLNSITHTGSISVTPTLLSSTQTTSSSKPGNMSTMGKGNAITNIPAGVPSLVGAQYTIVGQGGVPYIQQPPVYYEDFQLMQQQRLPPHIPITNLETLASSVYGQRRAQASAVNQSGNQGGHQQPLINPTAIPPAYAYFYGGSMIPGNFQFGGPTLYPVAAAGATSGHNNSSGAPYGKAPSTYPTGGTYSTGIYDGSQGSGVNDYKGNSNTGNVVSVAGVGGPNTTGVGANTAPKGHPNGPPQQQSQQQQSNNPPTTSDISNIYNKSHSALSKVGTYEKQGFHCATPPPFNLSSQNSGMGPAPGYAQHLFIPTMAAHHNTTLMHQQIHQDGPNTVAGRSQSNSANKAVPKSNYTSTYWTQN